MAVATEAAKALKTVLKLLKQTTGKSPLPSAPNPKKGPTPLPVPVDTKRAKARVPAKGVVVFKDAIKSVDEVLKRGMFDAESPEEVLEELGDFLFGSDDDYQADVIYEKMRKRILSQKAPKHLRKVNQIRTRKTKLTSLKKRGS